MVGLISEEKWTKTRILILELKTMVQEAMVKEREWRNTHLCIQANRDARVRRRCRWASRGGEAYQAWHTVATRMLLRQQLLEIRSFLNYVVRTYIWMNP